LARPGAEAFAITAMPQDEDAARSGSAIGMMRPPELSAQPSTHQAIVGSRQPCGHL
jgi:hypothetical protein